jgi:hypothetical protein
VVVDNLNVFSYKLSWCLIKLMFIDSCFVLDTADFNKFLNFLKMKFHRITVILLSGGFSERTELPFGGKSIFYWFICNISGPVLK